MEAHQLRTQQSRQLPWSRKNSVGLEMLCPDLAQFVTVKSVEAVTLLEPWAKLTVI